MAHIQQRIFVEQALELARQEFGLEIKTVLEFGSYDVVGSVRDLFPDSLEYVGVDLTEGPGVDLVYDGRHLDLTQDFDCIISCEMLEHDKYWDNSIRNMIKHSNRNSVIIFTCASTGRGEHGTDRSSSFLSPGTQVNGWNYYRNLSVRDIKKNFNLDEIFSSYFLYYEKSSYDLYFFGVFNPSHAIDNEAFKRELRYKIAAENRKIRQQSRFPVLRAIIGTIEYPLRWVLSHTFDEKLSYIYLLWRQKLIDKFRKKIAALRNSQD